MDARLDNQQRALDVPTGSNVVCIEKAAGPTQGYFFVDLSTGLLTSVILKTKNGGLIIPETNLSPSPELFEQFVEGCNAGSPVKQVRRFLLRNPIELQKVGRLRPQGLTPTEVDDLLASKQSDEVAGSKGNDLFLESSIPADGATVFAGRLRNALQIEPDISLIEAALARTSITSRKNLSMLGVTMLTYTATLACMEGDSEIPVKNRGYYRSRLLGKEITGELLRALIPEDLNEPMRRDDKRPQQGTINAFDDNCTMLIGLAVLSTPEADLIKALKSFYLSAVGREDIFPLRDKFAEVVPSDEATHAWVGDTFINYSVLRRAISEHSLKRKRILVRIQNHFDRYGLSEIEQALFPTGEELSTKDNASRDKLHEIGERFEARIGKLLLQKGPAEANELLERGLEVLAR